MNNTKTRKPNKRKSSVWQVVLLVFLSLVIVTAVFAGGYVIRSILVKPNPGGGDQNTLYTGSGGEDETTAGEEALNDGGPDVSGDKTDGYTRRDNVYNFLLIGRDAAGLNTDVMILASFDCTTGKISMCQMPRDTYAEYNGTYGKLNAAFASYYTAAKYAGKEDPTKTALEEMVNLFQTSLNIRLDYYMMINLDGFKAVVNRIGGVDMYVPYNMDYEDPEQDLYIHINKGQQTLMGDDAEGFVRYRSGYIQADIARADAQKMFISAFIAKIKSSISVPMITGLAADILPNLTTNMPSGDCIYFAKQALGINLSNITMMTMPGTSYKNGRFYIMQRKAMYNIINQYLNVYTKNIPENYFDVDRIYSDQTGSEIDTLYKSGGGTIVTYTADDVEENGIDIGLN